jgi:hypothetical protein
MIKRMADAKFFACSKGTLLVGLGILLSACNPFGDYASGGICASTGETTYRFSGAWKKVYGYSTPRTATELETDFDLLEIEPGDRVCEAGITNGASTGANYRALYRINTTQRTVDLQYDENNVPAPDATATTVRYSFQGTCDDTELLLRYPNGAVEKYSHYSSTVEVGSCDPQ